MSLSIVFSLHPFANIWSTVLKLHAIRFTTHEKVEYLAINQALTYFRPGTMARPSGRLELKESPQLG
jgi:hypothetical protein